MVFTEFTPHPHLLYTNISSSSTSFKEHSIGIILFPTGQVCYRTGLHFSQSPSLALPGDRASIIEPGQLHWRGSGVHLAGTWQSEAQCHPVGQEESTTLCSLDSLSLTPLHSIV